MNIKTQKQSRHILHINVKKWQAEIFEVREAAPLSDETL